MGEPPIEPAHFSLLVFSIHTLGIVFWPCVCVDTQGPLASVFTGVALALL